MGVDTYHASEKQLNFPSPRNASAEIKLDFDSADQCWFELRPEAVDASDPEVPGVNSPGWSYKILAVNDVGGVRHHINLGGGPSNILACFTDNRFPVNREPDQYCGLDINEHDADLDI